jgi:hypothetical protein
VNKIKNVLAVPVEDPASNNILHNALEACNKGSHQKKLKLHLIAYLCSNFRKCNIDSVISQPVVDAASMLRRMCTTRRHRVWTLVSDRAMLPG